MFKNKTLLITGGTGSFGNAVLKKFLNSDIKEQKGYKKKKAFILGHMGLGDHGYLNAMYRYIATMYDETYVVCKQSYSKNVEYFLRTTHLLYLILVKMI